MRAAKTDANHTDVVEELRYMGCLVQSLATIGAGCPDLLVGYRNRLCLIEVKDGSRRPSERRLNQLQLEWHKQWAGYPVFVVWSPADAIYAVLNHRQPEPPLDKHNDCAAGSED